jgi:LmbE family N-acetylglucosaminyl deacetylase
MTTRSLAAVFAHPDDETFSIAGTVATLAGRGVPCALFCATDGDAGRSSSVPVRSREELGRVRRAELLAAARILGFESVVTTGYADGALGAVDGDELVGRIVRFLRERRPTVVVTFGPEGAPNTHADHRVISRAATAAFFLAALPTAYPEQLAGSGADADATLTTHRAARLYYVSWDPPAPGETVGLKRKPAPHAVPATARLDVRAALGRKREAFMAHATQRDHIAEFETLALRPEELYALAAGVPQPSAIVDDLFVGL